MALTKIAEKKWTYTLYQSDGLYLLSVICGCVAMYELNIPIPASDAEKAIRDSTYLDRLASEIADNPHKFAPMSVKI